MIALTSEWLLLGDGIDIISSLGVVPRLNMFVGWPVRPLVKSSAGLIARANVSGANRMVPLLGLGAGGVV
jgi:hypothetical protein